MTLTTDRAVETRLDANVATVFSRAISERVVAMAIFTSCLAYLSIFLRYSALELDEGIVLQGAERILHGELPYRDFFSFYTPGSFYLLTFVFRIFGDSFLIARLTIAVSGAICSVLTYSLVRRACSRRTSLFCAVLATTTGAAFRFLVLHNPYSTLFSCLALYAAVRYIETESWVWSFATGSFASASLLIEQSKGVGLLCGLLLGFVLQHAMGRRALFPGVLRGAIPGIAWPLAITLGYFAARGALGVMLRDWIWPLQHYTQANHVPYGFQNWSQGTRTLIFYSGPLWLRILKVLAVSPNLTMPLLPLIGIGVLVCVVWTAREKRSSEFAYYVTVSSVCTGLLASVVIVRPDNLHFMYLAPIWYIILGWILDARLKNGLLQRARPYLSAYVAAACGMLALASLLPATGAHVRIQTRRGMIRTSAQETVIPYVQADVAEGESLLVYPYLPLYNYLTGTHSPSGYDFFQVGMNTREQAEEIISTLRSGAPVLFQPWFFETIPHSWAQTPTGAVANDLVADYVVHNYRVCAMLSSAEGSRFLWMQPKGSTCP